MRAPGTEGRRRAVLLWKFSGLPSACCSSPPFHHASFLLLPGKAAAMTAQRAAQLPLPSTEGSDRPLSQDGLSSYYLCVPLPLNCVTPSEPQPHSEYPSSSGKAA